MTRSEKLLMAIVCFALCIAIILAWARYAKAAPFLVCDFTTEDVTKYEIEVNGTVQPATLEKWMDNGRVRIKHDLESFNTGEYTVRARAGNVWGWSDWSAPFDFAKAVPTAASTAGLGIEE